MANVIFLCFSGMVFYFSLFQTSFLLTLLFCWWQKWDRIQMSVSVCVLSSRTFYTFHTKLPSNTHFSMPFISIFILFFSFTCYHRLITTTGIILSSSFLSFPYFIFFFIFYFSFLYFHLSFFQVEEEAVGSWVSRGPAMDKFAHLRKGGHWAPGLGCIPTHSSALKPAGGGNTWEMTSFSSMSPQVHFFLLSVYLSLTMLCV